MQQEDDFDWKAYREDMNELKKERHSVWKAENTQVLTESGIPFESRNNGETLLIREPGKPKFDFFPSTGRWRTENKTFGGHAAKFIKMYQKIKGGLDGINQ